MVDSHKAHAARHTIFGGDFGMKKLVFPFAALWQSHASGVSIAVSGCRQAL